MKTALNLLFALAALSPSLSHASEWTYPFKENGVTEFYFESLEQADPDEVFEITPDGTLIIKGKDKPDSYLQTFDEYENYEIKLEFRWPGEPGESGIQIHSTNDRAHSIWPESIEIQLEPGKSGDFWLLNNSIEVAEEQMPEKAAERNRRIRLKPKREFGKPPPEVELPAKEWNALHIVAAKDTIKVFLNGFLVNDGKDASVESGMIAIQAKGSDLEIRNFRVRDLP